jgi:hypothetical protein
MRRNKFPSPPVLLPGGRGELNPNELKFRLPFHNKSIALMRGCFKPRSVFDVVLPSEAFNTARSVHQLLFAGKKRMARRANFNGEIFNR